MTQSTVFRRHEARRAQALAALQGAPLQQERDTADAEHACHHYVPHSLGDLMHESTIFRRHESRHHGVVHAPTVMATTSQKSAFSMSDLFVKSTIYQRHAARHAADIQHHQ